MLLPIENFIQDFSRLLFPHFCVACGCDLKDRDNILCFQCQLDLPFTNFYNLPNNPVEKSFYGRLHLQAAGSSFYFTKDSIMQYLLSELKYKQNISVGYYLGRLMGYQLKLSERFASIDLLIPMPLHPKKQKHRGYNQATILCKGIQSVWNKPIVDHAIIRKVFSNSQTLQNRIHRWENMEGIFVLKNRTEISHKHLLLVDDVTTTGATLEALGSVLEAEIGVKLSIATAAYTI
jgi:ComF family protein